MIKRRLSRRAIAGVGLGLFVALVVGVSLAPNLRSGASGASPAVLNHIARNNDRAAIEAAAQMRAESRVTTRAAESMLAAERRGSTEANAMLARFDNEAAGPSGPPPGAPAKQ